MLFLVGRVECLQGRFSSLNFSYNNYELRLLIILWGTIHEIKPVPRKSEVLISSLKMYVGLSMGKLNRTQTLSIATHLTYKDRENNQK